MHTAQRISITRRSDCSPCVFIIASIVTLAGTSFFLINKFIKEECRPALVELTCSQTAAINGSHASRATRANPPPAIKRKNTQCAISTSCIEINSNPSVLQVSCRNLSISLGRTHGQAFISTPPRRTQATLFCGVSLAAYTALNKSLTDEDAGTAMSEVVDSINTTLKDVWGFTQPSDLSGVKIPHIDFSGVMPRPATGSSSKKTRRDEESEKSHDAESASATEPLPIPPAKRPKRATRQTQPQLVPNINGLMPTGLSNDALNISDDDDVGEDEAEDEDNDAPPDEPTIMAMDAQVGLDLSSVIDPMKLSHDDMMCILCDYVPPLEKKDGTTASSDVMLYGPPGGGILLGGSMNDRDIGQRGVSAREIIKESENPDIQVMKLRTYINTCQANSVAIPKIVKYVLHIYNTRIKEFIPAHPAGSYPAKPEWKAKSLTYHLLGRHCALTREARLGMYRRLLDERMLWLRASGLEVIDGRTKKRKSNDKGWKEMLLLMKIGIAVDAELAKVQRPIGSVNSSHFAGVSVK